MQTELDFTADNHGSIITLTPLTESAKDWCADYLPADCQMFGSAYAIEPRYFGAIAYGICEAGFACNFTAEPN